MKIACTLVLCLIASLQLSTASAQVYQWKDSTGRTVISDTPPPSTTKGNRTISATPAKDSGAEAGAPAQKSTAEKNMEFKKRQQEARQKADKDAKEQLAADERKDNCERATRHIAALESGERLVTRDQNGDKRYMDDAERQQEIERTRKIMAESCK